MQNKMKRAVLAAVAALFVVPLLGACSDDATLTVYSGRTSSLVDPILQEFAADTGIDIQVRYGTSAGTVALILEEGENSPADVVLLQDAGALGALAQEGRLQELPDDLLNRVDSRFRSPAGEWVGLSGRARTVIYNTETMSPEDMPASILDFTNPEWEGRIGWAPTNGSFQAFVTALRVIHGDQAALDWLRGIDANDPNVYPNNITTVDAAARGEIDVGFVNHYYLHRFIAEEGEDFQARNFYFSNDVGALINVAGTGILDTADARDEAERFVDYLLSTEAQSFFAEETAEYPLIDGVEPIGEVPPLSELNPPDVDLGNLDDLQGTLDLMREAGVLP